MKLTLLISLVLLLSSCDPIKSYYKEIKDLGYIHYPSPMETAGPGTLVGGKPNRMSWVTSPDSCFPEEIDGVPTNIKRIDKTSIPSKERKITANGKASVGLIKAINMGMPFFKVGAQFSKVQTMALTMKGVHIEYFDTLHLMKFYNETLSETCKDLLNDFPFIIQALKVSEMEFKFYDRTGAALNFTVNNIKQILDVEASVDFIIENSTSLIIKTPKFIGYQLGRWRPGEEKPLYRASRVRFNKWVFENISVFGDRSESLSMLSNKMEENFELRELIKSNRSTDEHSVFLK